MEYISSRRILHLDLAARNCLLFSKNLVKIADFGLSKMLPEKESFLKVPMNSMKLPVKWTAIEGLLRYEFSTRSDVWSMGVVLWEIASLGEVPYGKVSNAVALDNLKRGYRLKQCDGSSDKYHEICLMCWVETPKDRPDFSSIMERLLHIKRDSALSSYPVVKKRDIGSCIKMVASIADCLVSPRLPRRNDCVANPPQTKLNDTQKGSSTLKTLFSSDMIRRVNSIPGAPKCAELKSSAQTRTVEEVPMGNPLTSPDFVSEMYNFSSDEDTTDPDTIQEEDDMKLGIHTLDRDSFITGFGGVEDDNVKALDEPLCKNKGPVCIYISDRGKCTMSISSGSNYCLHHTCKYPRCFRSKSSKHDLCLEHTQQSRTSSEKREGLIRAAKAQLALLKSMSLEAKASSHSMATLRKQWNG